MRRAASASICSLPLWTFGEPANSRAAPAAVSGPPFPASVVVLDVDGTMVDFERAMRAGLEAVSDALAARGGASAAPERLRELRDEVARDPAWSGRTLAEIRQESFRRVLDACGVRDPAAPGETRDLYFRVRNESMAVFPDVVEALAALRARGLRLAAGSNGNLPLASVGLDGYFEIAHYAEDAGVAKPDPAFFAQAVARMGVRPGEALAVGDRLDNDYGPARAAGLHAALIDRAGRFAGTPAFRLGSLRELPELVALPAGGGTG